jgi:hypothetical protein
LNTSATFGTSHGRASMRRLLVASFGSAASASSLKNSQKRFHWPSDVMPMKIC